MNKQEALELFRQALDRADEQLEAEMTARTGEIAVTRAEHETGVARIMEAFRGYRSRKVKRRILIALLAAVLAVLASCTVYVNRDKIASFVEKFYDGNVDVSFGDIPEDAPTEILEIYMPSYIPEGYELVEMYSDFAMVKAEWENSDGKKMVFRQFLLWGTVHGWDNEETEIKTLIINDIPVYYAQHNYETFYLWNDGNYSYKLSIEDSFTAEEIESILTLTLVVEE